GWMNGVSKTAFAPELELTRAMFVTVLARYAGAENGNDETATRAQTAAILMRLDQKRNNSPAQSFDAEAEDGLTVSVNAPEGALPADTEMNVTRVSDPAELDNIRSKLNGTLLAAADISFTKDGTELEPSAAVEVTMNVEGLESTEHPAVAHICADGSGFLHTPA
ncbi:MAG: hypothetical protein IIY70_04570, partial [Oscillospiraceae bacterium]|nr:hypothetical protein [Oscillospiraceae bacterium]